MDRRTIPHTDLDVSALCLGAAGFGTLVRGDALDRLIADFLEAGGNFFDTAHCYAFWEPNGDGASERELAASLRRLGAPRDVVIATKGGHPEGGPQYPRPDRYLAPEVIASDIDDSLERLGCETIDLYFLHRDDARVPVGEVVGTLNAEVERGRIRHFGASNWPVERIAEANEHAERHGLRGFVASEIQASLVDPDWPGGPDPAMRFLTDAACVWHAASGVSIIAYTATAGGYFAGAEPKPGAFDAPANRARFERARELATRTGCTPTQVALAYLLHRGPHIIPLFSTTRRDHLREALGAPAAPLTRADAAWLRDG